jgi:hypothetical protein
MRELTYFWVFWFGLVFFSIFAVSSVKAEVDQGEIFQEHRRQCLRLVKDNWPTKIIYKAVDRVNRSFSRDLAVRCWICEPAFTASVYEVRYIEGRKAYVTCTVRDGEEPKLDRYNDQNSFKPPG